MSLSLAVLATFWLPFSAPSKHPRGRLTKRRLYRLQCNHRPQARLRPAIGAGARQQSPFIRPFMQTRVGSASVTPKRSWFAVGRKRRCRPSGRPHRGHLGAPACSCCACRPPPGLAAGGRVPVHFGPRRLRSARCCTCCFRRSPALTIHASAPEPRPPVSVAAWDWPDAASAAACCVLHCLLSLIFWPRATVSGSKSHSLITFASLECRQPTNAAVMQDCKEAANRARQVCNLLRLTASLVEFALASL